MRINLPTQSTIYAYLDISYINQEGQPSAFYRWVENYVQYIKQFDCTVYALFRIRRYGEMIEKEEMRHFSSPPTIISSPGVAWRKLWFSKIIAQY